jgi:hypothetical protein
MRQQLICVWLFSNMTARTDDELLEPEPDASMNWGGSTQGRDEDAVEEVWGPVELLETQDATDERGEQKSNGGQRTLPHEPHESAALGDPTYLAEGPEPEAPALDIGRGRWRTSSSGDSDLSRTGPSIVDSIVRGPRGNRSGDEPSDSDAEEDGSEGSAN